MIFAIVLAKCLAALLHCLKKGATTLPGKAALRVKYNLLNRLSKGVRIICVTGTNGKTTTCALIAQALEDNGCSYFLNKSGANMLSGVATAFVMNSTVLGRCKKHYAVLECDENSMPLIARYLDAEIVVVTNLFRDQLDRYGEVSHTLEKIKEGIDLMPDALLVLNADCPLTYSLATRCANRFVTFGIRADLAEEAVSDNRFCPACSAPLAYQSHVFAHLGDYCCTRCGFSRPSCDLEVTDIAALSSCGATFLWRYEGEKALVSVSLGGVYNIYNCCAAALTLLSLKIRRLSALFAYSGAFGRMETFHCGGRRVLLLLVKNPVGLSNCLNYAAALQGRFDFAFVLNDKEADGRDVSWIWDSDFAPLQMKDSLFFTLGTRSFDMALRLKYAGIAVEEALAGEAYDELLRLIETAENDFVIFSTYTSMMALRKELVKRFGGKEFWQ